MLSFRTPPRHAGARPVAGPLVIAALAAATLLAACSGGATPSPSAGGASPSAAGASPSSGASGQPGNGAADLLAKTLPTTVGDVTLTVRSGTLADMQGDIPNYDDLVARLANASVQPDGVVAAVAMPADGGKDPRVAGLTVLQAPPGGLGLLGLMQAWTSGIPGATSKNTNVGGKPVVMVTFSDGSLPMYYYLFDSNKTDAESADTMYFVRTADETLAADALSQLP